MARNLHLLKISIAIVVATATWLDGLRNGLGCGPDIDLSREQISYFEPQIVADSLYQSYYRSLFKHIRSDEYYGAFSFSYDSTTINDNVREWSAYFGDRVPPLGVRNFIYLSSENALDTLYGRLKEGGSVTIPDTLAGNALAQEIVRRRDLAALRYIIYARACEDATIAGNAWEGAKNVDSTQLAGLAIRGESEYADCSSDFLKLRYAYQLVRLAHIAGDYQMAVDRYDRLVDPNRTQSIIRYWGLGYKAGALKMLDSLPRSLYLFSQVFDSCEEHRELALRDFTLDNEGVWDQTFALARNDHERGTLWMMRGLTDQALVLEPLKQMYRYEPGSSRLEAMLLRQVETVEETIYSQQVTQSYQHLNRSRDIAPIAQTEEGGDTIPMIGYLSTLENFATSAVHAGNVHDQALWYVTAGYLALMQGAFDRSRSLLDQAVRVENGNPDIIHQAKLLRYLTTVKGKEPLAPSDEEGIAAELDWLLAKGKQNGHAKYDRAMLAMAQKYLQQGDVPKAALCFINGGDDVSMAALLDMYASNEDLEKLDGKIVSGGGSGFERELVKDFPLGHEEMLDIRGTRLLRQGRYGEALRIFQSISPGYWRRNIGDVARDSSSAVRFWLGYGDGYCVFPKYFFDFPKLSIGSLLKVESIIFVLNQRSSNDVTKPRRLGTE